MRDDTPIRLSGKKVIVPINADAKSLHPTRDTAINTIARDFLYIETLAERKSDSLDFHEVSVWDLKDALRAAYEAGVAEARNGGAA